MANNTIKLSLCPESASALREFATAMPLAVSNLMESYEKLKQVYNSLTDSLGVHRDDFLQMLLIIEKSQTYAADSISTLPKMLENTAVKIDNYVATHPTVK